MAFLKRHYLLFAACTAITIVYFATRFFNLMALPIFTDEAIYMWWAQTGKIDASWRFMSLVDGKQPLYIWLSMAVMYLVNDPLLAGRLVSVFAGFVTVAGLFFLGWELFRNKWVGTVAAAIYVVFPFALVHDRMALYDTLVGTLFIWALYGAVLLVKHIHSTLAFILGMVMGAAVLTKSSGFFTAALLPSTLLLFNFRGHDRVRRFLLWALYACIAIGLAFAYYSVLRLSPFFGTIAQKNTEFVYPFIEWVQHPFAYFIPNTNGIIQTIVIYFSAPILGLVFLSVFVTKQYWKEKLLLLLWFITPLIYLAFFGKLIYPRHYFFTTLFLLPLTGVTLLYLWKKLRYPVIFFLLCFLFFIPSLYTDFLILTNLPKAPIPSIDKSQYSTGWPAGGGVKEAIAFFNDQAKDKKINVFTQGTFGLMPYALELYLRSNKNIWISGVWPTDEKMLSEIITKAKERPTYVLFYQDCPICEETGKAPAHWPLEKRSQIEKSDGIYQTIYFVTNN